MPTPSTNPRYRAYRCLHHLLLLACLSINLPRPIVDGGLSGFKATVALMNKNSSDAACIRGPIICRSAPIVAPKFRIYLDLM